jgi:autoinducer 2-degrading protein
MLHIIYIYLHHNNITKQKTPTMTRFWIWTVTLALALALADVHIHVQSFVPHPHAVSPSLTRTPAAVSSCRLYAQQQQQQQQQAEPKKLFAVIVQTTIEPDRMAEFMELIQINAEGTRKEPGCLRFDVVRSQEAPNQFFFYELYQNAEAMDYHKTQSHFKLWADFKASGGTISSVSHKADGEFIS